MLTGCLGTQDIGANPSAEEQEEALDETSVQVIDIVDAFRLQKTEYDKKSYMSHLKGTCALST
jgi:Translationally controlled tumour protein